MLKRESKVEDIFLFTETIFATWMQRQNLLYIRFAVLHDGDRIEKWHYFDFIPKNFNEREKKQDGIEVTGTPV